MRRLFWLALGLGAGAVAALMAGRFTRRQIERAKPQAIAREAKGGLLDLSKLVAESIEEGRRARDERERELRDAYGSPGDASGGSPGASGSQVG